MKTCMVYPNFNSEKGISKFTLELINLLKAVSVPIKEFTYTQGKPKTFYKHLKEIKEYDIIHIQHEYNLLGKLGLPFFWIYLKLGAFRKNKIITTMHTVLSKKEKFEGSKLKTFARKRFYPVANFIISKFSDKVIVYSKHFKKILVDEYNFPEKKVVILPLTMAKVKIPNKNKSKKELGLSGKINLMIGTMNPYHDYESLLEKAKDIDGKILIATSASAVNYRNTEKLEDSLEKIREKIKQKKLNKKVDLRVGFIPFKKWWKYISASDFVLMPYKGGVGSGVFYDAILMKKPVIATPVPFFKTVEEDYGCVKTCKVEDFPKIIEKMSKNKEYNRMLKECERFIKNNGAKTVSKKWKNLYAELA